MNIVRLCVYVATIGAAAQAGPVVQIGSAEQKKLISGKSIACLGLAATALGIATTFSSKARPSKNLVVDPLRVRFFDQKGMPLPQFYAEQEAVAADGMAVSSRSKTCPSRTRTLGLSGIRFPSRIRLFKDPELAVERRRQEIRDAGKRRHPLGVIHRDPLV